MENKKASVFDKLYFPRKLNHEYVSEYFASKASGASRRLGNYNCGDNIERNVEITNYLVRRKLARATKKLEKKRKDFSDKSKIVQEQWEDLKEKESSLRENFIRFNQFVKENQEKKERALTKIVEQSQLKEERQKKTNELMDKCEEMNEIKRKMDKKITQYRIYEEFLLKVIDKEKSMQTINDLLKRYEALIGARNELNEIQQRDLMKLEKAKSVLTEKTDQYLNTLSALNNRVNDLKARYEKAQMECKKWETIHNNSKLEASDVVIQTEAIKQTCLKMYVEICRRKKMKPVHIEDVEQQLHVIKQALGEYEIINKRMRYIRDNVFRESVEPKASDSS